MIEDEFKIGDLLMICAKSKKMGRFARFRNYDNLGVTYARVGFTPILIIDSLTKKDYLLLVNGKRVSTTYDWLKLYCVLFSYDSENRLTDEI